MERGSREEKRRKGAVHSTDTEKVDSIPHFTPNQGRGRGGEPKDLFYTLPQKREGKGEGKLRTYFILYHKNKAGEGKGEGRLRSCQPLTMLPSTAPSTHTQ